jgi:hypothetical protein
MKIISNNERRAELDKISGNGAASWAADSGTFYVVAEGKYDDDGVYVVMRCEAFTVERYSDRHGRMLSSFEWRTAEKVADCFSLAAAKASATRRNRAAFHKAA